MSHAGPRGILRWIDLPPVWLAGFIAAAWALSRAVPGVAGGWADAMGWALIGFGLLLMAAAAGAMFAARTTVHPHDQPEALVRGGIFRLSRNPIYLGDAAILAGAALIFGGAGLVLVPVFMALIARRFIRREEARLAARFGAEFHDYAARVRRWL